MIDGKGKTMIEAVFRAYPSDKRLTFALSGHAGTAEPGKDLVCAAASILASTMAQSVTAYSDCVKDFPSPNVDLQSGKADISVECDTDESYQFLLIAFMTIQVGFILLEYTYPDNIKVDQLKAE